LRPYTGRCPPLVHVDLSAFSYHAFLGVRPCPPLQKMRGMPDNAVTELLFTCVTSRGCPRRQPDAFSSPHPIKKFPVPLIVQPFEFFDGFWATCLLLIQARTSMVHPGHRQSNLVFLELCRSRCSRSALEIPGWQVEIPSDLHAETSSDYFMVLSECIYAVGDRLLESAPSIQDSS
jgi:hypothetical protein